MKTNSKSAALAQQRNIQSAAANGVRAGAQATTSPTPSPIETVIGKIDGSLADLSAAIARAEGAFEVALSEPTPTPEVASDPAVSHLHSYLLGFESQLRNAIVRLNQLADRSTL